MAEEVVDEILWTNTAKRSFNNIVEYLEAEWTGKEIENLIAQTQEFIAVLKRHPEMCRPSLKRKNVRIGF
jgi:plasmid stabilization system protein ParE